MPPFPLALHIRIYKYICISVYSFICISHLPRDNRLAISTQLTVYTHKRKFVIQLYEKVDNDRPGREQGGPPGTVKLMQWQEDPQT